MNTLTPTEKKIQILRLLPLGVDFFSACIELRCSDSEIEALQEDEEFQLEVQFTQNQEKSRLLRLYKETAENSARVKLDYNGVRAVIKDFFPGTLDDTDSGKGKIDLSVYLPDNGR